MGLFDVLAINGAVLFSAISDVISLELDMFVDGEIDCGYTCWEN
jgi:hypothetical protein